MTGSTQVLRFQGSRLGSVQVPINRRGRLNAAAKATLFSRVHRLNSIVRPKSKSKETTVSTFCSYVTQTRHQAIQASTSTATRSFRSFFTIVKGTATQIKRRERSVAIRVDSVNAQSNTMRRTSNQSRVRNFLFFVRFRRDFVTRFQHSFCLDRTVDVARHSLFMRGLR